MGINQFLLMALGFIIVGVAIRVGVNQFNANEIEHDRILLIDNIKVIALNAYIYRTKTTNLGGGKASYIGFTLSKKYGSNDAGSYKVTVSANTITITATSNLGNGTIAMNFDQNGKYVNKSLQYTGTFK